MTTIKANKIINYVIVWNDDRTQIKSYSILNTGQQLQTKLKEVDVYDNNLEYLNILLKNGIVLDN